MPALLPTAAMTCPIAWADVEDIVIARVDDEATVTSEGEAEGGDEAIVTGESPVVDGDDIVDKVDYVIIDEVLLIDLEVVRRITCR